MIKAKYKEGILVINMMGLKIGIADRVFPYTDIYEVRREKKRLLQLKKKIDKKIAIRLKMCDIIEEVEHEQ